MKLFYRIEGMRSTGEDFVDIVVIDVLAGMNINKYLSKHNIYTTKPPKLKLEETISYNIGSIFGKSSVSLNDEELYIFISGLKDSQETEMGQLEQFQFLNEIFASNKMKKLVSNIEEQVTLNGMPLYVALKENGFPIYVTSSIEVGSEAGNILLVLEKLLVLIQTKIDTARSIKKMMREPKIVGTFLIGYFFFTMFYFIPKSKPLLQFSDPQKWPEITKTLVGWSDQANESTISFVLITFIVIGVIIYALKFLFKILGYLIPFIRRIKENQEISLVFSVLTVSAYSNVLLQDSLRQASGIVTNKKMKNDLYEIAEAIEIGETFSSELKRKKFPTEVCVMVKAGESVSKYAQYFEKIANKYKIRTDDSIELALAFIKPLTLVFAATTLITIYYGVNAPLLNFGDIGQ